jgi:hypothetical protein
LPHREEQQTKKQRIEQPAKPKPCGTKRSSSRLAVCGSVDYVGESPAQFADRAGAGDTAGNKRRLANLARRDDAGNSGSDDKNSASEVCLHFRRNVGSSLRACCANEMMPAQEVSQASDEYDSDESNKSVASSAASVDSGPLVTRRPAKKIAAEQSNAPTAGQVSSLRAARSVHPLLRATCGGSCSLHFGESSVQREFCRRRRRRLQEQMSRTRLGRRRRR